MRVKSKRPKSAMLQSESPFQETISIEQLQAIWDDDTIKYSPEEIIKIKEWLYTITEVIFKVSLRTERKLINLNIENDTESNNLYKSEYRRAS